MTSNTKKENGSGASVRHGILKRLGRHMVGLQHPTVGPNRLDTLLKQKERFENGKEFSSPFFYVSVSLSFLQNQSYEKYRTFN